MFLTALCHIYRGESNGVLRDQPRAFLSREHFPYHSFNVMKRALVSPVPPPFAPRCSVDKRVSQILNGHTGTFATIKIPGRLEPAQVS